MALEASLEVEVFHLEKYPSFINTCVLIPQKTNNTKFYNVTNVVIYQYEFYNADSNHEFKRKRASTSTIQQ